MTICKTVSTAFPFCQYSIVPSSASKAVLRRSYHSPTAVREESTAATMSEVELEGLRRVWARGEEEDTTDGKERRASRENEGRTSG
jgi:hypothetical protein